MNKKPSVTQNKTNRLALPLLAAAFAALAVNTASAELTFQLSAVSATNGALITNTTLNNQSIGTAVTNAAVGTVVTLDIWAQVTTATTGTNSIWGMSAAVGNIVTSGTSPFLVGSMSTATINTAFTSSFSPGTTLLNANTGSTDLGAPSTNTASSSANIELQANTTANGTLVGSTDYVTSSTPEGDTVVSLTGGSIFGSSFLLGTATFTISSAASPSSVSLNWQIPPSFSGGAQKGVRAGWTQADGASDTGNLQSGSMTAGTALLISAVAVPEPGTWAMLLGGFGTLFGIQRFRRKTA
jgi:hypothetical protein